MKKKYLRANHATFMTKEVRKAIMIRSKLRNKFLKDKNEQSRNDYRKQRNLCVALVRRAKQQYFSSLDLSLIADNKKFWKTVKPLFSDKISHKDTISLKEDGKTITEVLPIAEIFNNLVFRNYPTILSINKNMGRIGCPSFAFEFVSLEETIKKLIN